MTRAELVAAVLADPEAALAVVDALRAGVAKVAGPWVNDCRRPVGVGAGGEIIAYAMPLMQSYSCKINDPNAWEQWYHDGTRAEARRVVDEKLKAAGWLLCGEGA